jgi:hypothetical protein
MKNYLFPMMVAALLSILPIPAEGETTYLYATFDDKALGLPIGMGGASLGEPVSMNDGLITAIVREGPAPTPCLEIQDITDYSAGSVDFEFLGSQEVTTGFLSIAVDLWFHEFGDGNQFELFVREQGSAACSFADIRFLGAGNVLLNDHANPTAVIGTYVTGKVFPVVFNFYLEGGTYDVWLDGLQVVSQQAHGVTGCGIGGVLVGCDHDADLNGKISVDRIRVTDFHQEVAAESPSWGGLRWLYR